MISLTFSGVPAVVANAIKFGDIKRQRAAQGLYLYGELVMTTAKRDYVPVDTGNLRSTGYVQLPFFSGNEISVRLAFGGPAASYAAEVHEDLTGRIPREGGVGGPKYLERPMVLLAPGCAAFVAARVAA